MGGAHACQGVKVLHYRGRLSLPNRQERRWLSTGRRQFNLFVMPDTSEENATTSPGFVGAGDMLTAMSVGHLSVTIPCYRVLAISRQRTLSDSLTL